MTGLTNYRRRNDLSTRFDSLFNSLWGDFDRDFGRLFKDFNFSLSKGGYPRVDVVDYADRTVIEASVPGLTKEQVNVEYADDVLTISGESQNVTEDGERAYRELHRSKFSRSMTLDASKYDVEQIQAEVKDGLLTVSIPKTTVEKKEVKKIEVRG